RGVRVMWIIGGVVEMRCALDLRALGENNGLREVVPELPMPVVVRNTEQRFRFARGIDQAIFEILPAPMHVGMQAGQSHSGTHGELRMHAVVRISGWNRELSIRGGQGEYALLRRLFGEDQSEFAPVRAGLAIGCVM